MPIDLGLKPVIIVKPIEVVQSNFEYIGQSVTTSSIAESPTVRDSAWNIDPIKIIGFTLITISILFFIRFLYRFGSIILIRTSGKRLDTHNGINLILTDRTDNAFSFLGYIFINPLKFNDEEKRLIIDHEREHIRHFHSIDLILIELLIVLQWFNPFAYIARRKLIEIHEFIADNGVIRKGADPYSYQNLLLSVVTSSCLPSAGNQLSAFITKKRIAMIGKPLNQSGKRVNFLVLIPIAVILIIGISAFSPKKPIRLDATKKESIPSVQQEPLTSLKEPNITNVVAENPIAIEKKDDSAKPEESTIINRKEENLEPLKRIDAKSLINESSITKETRINILPVRQQDIKEELIKRAEAEITDEYLKDFYFNFNLPPSGSSTNLSPNASTTRYSVILKKGIIYNLYYFSGSKDDKLRAFIGTGKGNESIIEQIDFSYFAKKTIEPKVTAAYHIEVDNLSSKNVVALLYLTSAGERKGLETKDEQANNLDFFKKESSRNNNVELADTLDQVFLVVEDMPSFGNGEQDDFRTWVASNMQYPKEEAEKGIQGRVYLQFIVEKDGSISNVKVARSADPVLDKEAIRIVKSSPKWNPGMQRGVPVRVQYTFPIIFSLNK